MGSWFDSKAWHLFNNARVVQWLECLLAKEKVAGSNPVSRSLVNMTKPNNLKLISITTPSPPQAQAIRQLQQLCFTDVDELEAQEDFYHQPAVHITEQHYLDQPVKLGGYGICTHPNFRRQGIATRVVNKAMQYLKQQQCDVAFLSVDPNNQAAVKLHQQHGFVMLSQNFTWTNSKGQLKQDTGGMLAPLVSQKLFDLIISGTEPLYVGHGYW